MEGVDVVVTTGNVARGMLASSGGSEGRRMSHITTMATTPLTTAETRRRIPIKAIQ
jgi:hypothetical protein